MAYTPDTFKQNDLLTSAHLNKISQGIKTNSDEIEVAKEQLAAAQQQLSTISEDNTDLRASVENSISQMEQLIADLENNAQGDSATAQAVASNLEKINENKTSINSLIEGLAANSELDNTVKALAESNKAVNDAQAETLTNHEGRIGTIEQDYVSKTDTKNAFKAQSLYNVVTYKYTANNVESMVWNEASGGGCMIHNKGLKIKSFLGVNDAGESGGVWAQFYAKNTDTNVGTRVNFSDTGVYYTKGRANGSFTADDELITKAVLDAAVADIEIPEVKDSSAEIESLKSQIAVLTNVINSKKVGAIAGDANSEAVEGVVGDANSDVVVTASAPLAAKTTIVGKDVTVQDVTSDGNTIIVNASGAVNVTGLVSANVPKSQSNAGISIHTSDSVYFANSDVNAVYNGIEIGLNAADTPKDIVIDGVALASGNNAISIFNTADNANVTIKNCTVGQVSEFLRISNRDNVHVNIFLENVDIAAVDTNLSSGWSNLILCQDYTSMSADIFEENNRFSPDKVKIYFKNVKLGGQLVTADTPVGASTTEVGSTSVLVVYNYKLENGNGAFGFVAGTETDKYPQIIFQD